MPILNTLSSASVRGYGMLQGSSVADPFFANTVLLLHGDLNGTSTDNFSILDSSNNNISVSRQASPYSQSTFSPYSNGYQVGSWSYWLANSFPTILFSSNAMFQFGTGNFTIEFWVNPQVPWVSAAQTFGTIVDFRASDVTTTQIAIGLSQSTSGCSLVSCGMPSGTGTATLSSINRGEWSHVAVVRNGANFITFINGTQVSLIAAGASNYTDQNFAVGRTTVNGVIINSAFAFVSNLRVVKGQALYTGAFTPSTIPISASSNGNATGNVSAVVSSNVAAMVCQDSNYKNNSNYTLTISGGLKPPISSLNPFSVLEPYSPIRHNGSYNFWNGGSDAITVNASSQNQLLNQDFTIEGFFIYNAITASQGIQTAVSWENNNGPGIAFNTTSSDILYINNIITFGASDTFAISSLTGLNAWNHIALVRAGSVVTVYLNGKSITSYTGVTTNFTASSPRIGSGANFRGNIADFRIVKGTAVYNGDFSPPTSPLQVIPNTSLLLRFNNFAIFDSAAKTQIGTNSSVGSVSGPIVDSSQKIFGTASLKFVRSLSQTIFCQFIPRSLSQASPTAIAIGPKFTIEMWIRKTLSVEQGLIGCNSSAVTSGFRLKLNASNQLQFLAGVNSATLIASSTTTIPDLTWTHVAVTREGYGTDQVKIWINGIQSGAGTYAADLQFSDNTPTQVGTAQSEFFDGHIDEVRFTQGVARYTSNFTPVGPFPNQ